MSAKSRKKQAAGIPDVWVLCGLFGLLLILFFLPGIIIENRPVSAFQLMRASELYQYGQFPGSLAGAREIATLPILSALGLALTLAFRTGTGKYAFGASISALLFGLISVYQNRYLPHAGGFVVGTALVICVALFFVSIICALVRR